MLQELMVAADTPPEVVPRRVQVPIESSPFTPERGLDGE